MSEIKVNKIKMSQVNDTVTAPDFQKSQNSDIISYGSKVSGARYGDYPDRLIGLYQNSSLHSAIINGKILQIVSDGFHITENQTPTTTGETTTQVSDEEIMLNNFFENINDDEEIDDLLPKTVNDHQIFGGFATFVTFSRDFKKITRVQHIEYDKCRTTDYNDRGKIDYWYVSNNWSSQKATKKKYRVITNFKSIKLKAEAYEKALNTGDVNKIKELSCDYTVIYYHNNYTSGRDYYPLPQYVAAIEAIDASQQVDTYFNNGMKKGMNSDGMLITKGNVEDEDFDSEADALRAAYQGAVNAGDLMIVRAKDDDNKPEYIPFNAKGEDGRVKQVIDETTNRILTTHGVTSPLLIGIKTEGQLGGATELKVASQLFYRNTIQPQQLIIEKYFNRILKYNNLPKVELRQLQLIDDEIINK